MKNEIIKTKNTPVAFPISVFNTEKASETLSRARVRIFYKGLNRNGSYITEEFAEELVKTLPYAPIKGIYDEDEEDYEDHGKARTEGRIYGVVPQEMNFAWEKHLDEDGMEREYAVTDVLIFSALYEEAEEIVGKGQSMELYGPSIKGEWLSVDDKYVFKYSSGCFLGLQVLGDDVEPCFEGAAFFAQEANDIREQLNKVFEMFQKIENKGKENMHKEIFALSDRQKENIIFKKLNTETYRYIVVDNYEDYAIVYDMEEDNYKKVSFTKEEDDVILADEMAPVFAEFLTEDEIAKVNELRAEDDDRNAFSFLCETNDTLKSTIEERDSLLATKEAEFATLELDRETIAKEKEALELEVEGFRASFAAQEKADKEELIGRYSEKLSEETLSEYSAKIDEYTVESLERELAYTLVKSDASIFSARDEGAYVPKPKPVSGIESLLLKHSKK